MKHNILQILSSIGIIDSLYLTYIKLSSNPHICSFAQCDKVQLSQYSEIFGIPVAVLGIIYYMILFIGINKKLDYFNKIWIMWGVMFSSALTYLQLFVVKAICGWCLLSFANILIIAFLYFSKQKKKLWFI